jgi:hypothetical protein
VSRQIFRPPPPTESCQPPHRSLVVRFVFFLDAYVRSCLNQSHPQAIHTQGSQVIDLWIRLQSHGDCSWEYQTLRRYYSLLSSLSELTTRMSPTYQRRGPSHGKSRISIFSFRHQDSAHRFTMVRIGRSFTRGGRLFLFHTIYSATTWVF